MFGGAPIGATPLGGSFGGAAEPVPVGGANAIRWVARLLVDGVDWSSRLVGEPQVDREEGAAGICSFDLCLPAGPVTPTDWKGRSVALDYIGTMAGVTTEQRLFTGRVADPSWNRTTRTLSCTCSDQLQQRVEAMEISAIDALVGGYWSEDVFEPVAGRSRWDYAQERLSTRAASLDCDAYGSVRVTSWYTAAQPDFTFGAGSTVYDSLDVQLSDLSVQINTVEIEGDYRFSRLWQRNLTYVWAHPDMAGTSGMTGFCLWIQHTTELPTIEMIESAVSGGGQTVISSAYQVLPSSGTYCDPPIGYAAPRNHKELVLAARVVGARRWNQAVTESYKLRVVAGASVAAVGEVIERQGAAVEVESDLAEAWESDEITGGTSGHQDVRDEPRRQAQLLTLLNQAGATIVAAHRGTQLSWDVPASWVTGLDLRHTVHLDDQGARAKGKVARLQHRLSLETGVALTTVTIAVMRGGGAVSDPLVPPPFSVLPPEEEEGPSPIEDSMPTQLADGIDDLPYDETLDGFSGNYSQTSGDYPRRFQATADEVLETLRDENVVEIPAVYRIAIPNDLLELY